MPSQWPPRRREERTRALSLDTDASISTTQPTGTVVPVAATTVLVAPIVAPVADTVVQVVVIVALVVGTAVLVAGTAVLVAPTAAPVETTVVLAGGTAVRGAEEEDMAGPHIVDTRYKVPISGGSGRVDSDFFYKYHVFFAGSCAANIAISYV